MTRKDYELIARAMRDNLPQGQVYLSTRQHVWQEICETLAKEFKADNPAFKPEVFYKACGLES